MYVEVLSLELVIGRVDLADGHIKFLLDRRRVRQASEKSGQIPPLLGDVPGQLIAVSHDRIPRQRASRVVLCYPRIWVLSGLAMGLNAAVCGLTRWHVASGSRNPIAMPVLKGAHGAV